MAEIHKALLKVQRGIAERGIDKTRRNREQGFNFRGIDDALGAFAPLLTEAGILLSPSYSDLTVEPRPTKSGGTTYNVRVAGVYTFTSVEDGSTHTVGPFYGEANDGQDKAVSKATSIAERNMFFLTFVVPHEPAIGGDPDGHGEHEGEGVPQDLLDAARAKALEGTPAYAAWWSILTKSQRMALMPEHESLKQAAKAADEAAQ